MKYIVWKTEDVLDVTTAEETIAVDSISEKISEKRELEGKKDNKYLVVNMDEPYADQVKKLIEDHEGERIQFD